MPDKDYNFSDVSLLITVYNRSSSLERLLDSFIALGIQFGEIIVSDDASKEPHLSKMKNLQDKYHFNLVTTPKNGGLGNNINKGQREVGLPYTLYVQEDFVPREAFAENFTSALAILKRDQQVDTIRFYGYFPYPYTKPYSNGFNEMIFKPSLFNWNHLKFYVYSDHPHLRRSNFTDKFGEYIEGRNVNVTEFDMSLSFIKKGGKGLLTTGINELFDQKNSPDEPSTANRSSWKESNNIFVRAMRKGFLVFRYLKNNVQLIKKTS